MKRIVFPVSLLAFAVACATDGTPTAPPASKPMGPTFDDIANDLDPTIDVVAEVMPLNVGGLTGTTTLYVTPRNGDGKNGCNLTSSTTLVVAVASNNTSVATVSPSSVTFTACGDTKTLTIAPVAQGTATISISQTSNNTGGTFNLAPASFTVNVSPPPNTAPSVIVDGVTGGASYNKGSVPAATCRVTDAEDGNSSFAATLSTVTGTYASDGIGSQTASCSYTDAGGLTASASITYAIVDPSAPSIASTLNPASADGSNGWYKSNVTLTWTVTENESPNSLQKTGCVNQNISTDQTAAEYKCSATSAGGSANGLAVTIKRDATAPTISGSASPAANGKGWNNTDVTVSFSCSDATSGVATCSSSTTLGEGAAQSVSGSATDNAGNGASASVTGINIDKTLPNVSLVGGPASGGEYPFGSVPAAPTCSATDALSGLDGVCTVSGYSTAVGTHTVTATATDKAGNPNSASLTYTVQPWRLAGFYAPVDMLDVNGNAIFNTVRAGQAVPLKFNVYAGLTEQTTTAAVQKFSALQTTCSVTATFDDVEITNTGATSLRYDATAGQFIQNWQTPKEAGKCFRVTVITADGSSIWALFKLK
jgi:hypothetical protein